MTSPNDLRECWFELERLTACRQAVTALLVPEPDLHAVNRDNLCQLLGYLDEQEARLIATLQPLLSRCA
ncbi:hypothetical protein EZI54_03915 [Marinobacter halodurans]|uniref:Uncharacterized protein n=1 Tax=Marinobacter halodurans TaxID=2528979 RepID=A0ABY1ZRP3_9GAMM|nr:hypothetical protein [Marinobacter halodurans]TBW58539.1 hypothetical protein EZI54_03915 [Marinobacter halodurans]